MSEDDIDNLLSKIIDWYADKPADWPDNDKLFDEFKEILYSWGDPFYTKERNYN